MTASPADNILANRQKNNPSPRQGVYVVLAALLALVLVVLITWTPLIKLEEIWGRREEYSHGYLIPLISLFLVWQNRYELAQIKMGGSWVGLLVLLAGLLMFMMGDLSTLFVVQHYAIVVILFGLVWAFTGARALRILWVPLVYLLFMVPLPPFLYNNLSQQLQLISSELGVAVIRWFGISVFLEGNVIDLGIYKLQVVEACSGLRYLFPLMSIGFLVAYLYDAPVWKRAVVFLSTIPITILMNSFRIGVIGVLVDNYGIKQAEGFLHLFEGWIIFMSCLVLLLIEMWLLMRITGDKRPFGKAFGFVVAAHGSGNSQIDQWKLSQPFIAALVLLGITALVVPALGERVENIPNRTAFTDFPMRLGEWAGKRDTLDEIYLEALDHPDYIIADYTDSAGDRVNLYVAYYASQRTGAAAHSPRACIPGGGWEIKDLKKYRVEGVEVAGKPLYVNRLKIQKGEYKQLVYYWFQQRDRILTSEYAVKWYLFWDALTRLRTDGALLRMTTLMGPTEDWSDGDKRLRKFTGAFKDKMGVYLPD